MKYSYFKIITLYEVIHMQLQNAEGTWKCVESLDDDIECPLTTPHPPKLKAPFIK